MADFKGFQCDNCKAVGPDDERTRVTTNYEGPSIKGNTAQDLCPQCAPKPDQVPDFKPKKAKAPAKKAAAQADPPVRSA
jgi:hypothetical protein